MPSQMGAATFIISSKEIQPDESRESSSLEDDTYVSSDDTEKWDKVLDDYEEYVDKNNCHNEEDEKKSSIDAALDYPALSRSPKNCKKV